MHKFRIVRINQYFLILWKYSLQNTVSLLGKKLKRLVCFIYSMFLSQVLLSSCYKAKASYKLSPQKARKFIT